MGALALTSYAVTIGVLVLTPWAMTMGVLGHYQRLHLPGLLVQRLFLLALTPNIRLKMLKVSNTLAYCREILKKFNVTGP